MPHRRALPIAMVLVWLSMGAASAQDFDDGQATLQGFVTEVGTGQPLEGVTIHLDSRLSSPAAVTDVTGRFVIAGLAPGAYRMFAERDGRVFTETCRLQPELPCMDLTIPYGESVEVQLQMRKAAALSGQVLDASGDPVVGVRVSLKTYDYASGIPGQRALVDFPLASEAHSRDLLDCRASSPREVAPEGPSVASRCEELAFGGEIGRGVTDEQGQWRLDGVPPGEYYVVVSPERAEALDRALPERQGGMWLPIYYPGTRFEDSAAPVRVTAAPEVPGIDIQWTEHAPVSIRGTVSGLPENLGRAIPFGDAAFRIDGLRVSITTANGLPITTAESKFLGGIAEQVNQTTGDFQFLVPPSDEYVLTATVGSHGGRLRLNVGTSDVDDIVLPLAQAVDVPGQILFDPLPPPEEVAQVWLSFSYRSPNGSTVKGSPVSPDGTFVFENPDPVQWDWDISATSLPQGYYLESADFGGVDLLRAAFNPGDAPGSVLLLRFGNSPGAVTGRVVDIRGDLFEGAKVTLVPEGALGGRRDLYRSIESDAEGEFTLDAIPPGSYRVFAWESIPDSAERNTDFLAPYLGRGRFVTVDENVTVDVELSLIER